MVLDELLERAWLHEGERLMSDGRDRHNSLAPMLFKMLIEGTSSEVEAMVVLESVVLGVMRYYRPDPRHAAEFLDVMTATVIESLRK